MKKELRDYVKIYKNCFTPQVCEDTIAQLNSVEFQKNTFYNEKTGTPENIGDDPNSYTGKIPNTDQLMSTTWKILEQYIVKELQFPWFDRWNGFSITKFNMYEPGLQMKEHCDHIRDIFSGDIKGVPILTVLGLLNDNYIGGELVLFTDEVYKLSAGDVIVFPSNFLYPHRVNPVISGKRYSTVHWVW